MYFKKSRSGLRTVVFRYEGYNREKKRSAQTMIGTISEGVFIPVEGRGITDEERREIDARIAVERDEQERQARLMLTESFPRLIKSVADAVRNKEKTEFSAEWAQAFWSGTEIIGRALRKQKSGKWAVLRSESPEAKGDE